MEDNHNFESFLGELSAELVNLPLESIDAVIENSIKKLVEFFDADRCHIGELSKDQSKILVSYFYSRPGIQVPQITEIGEHYLSFIYRSVKEEKILCFNETSEIPEHSKKDRDVIEGLGIQSLLVVPLKINDDVRFGLSLSTLGRKHQWDSQSIGRIMIIGNILVNTMQRRLFLEQINTEKEWSEAIIQGLPQLNYVFDIQGRMKRWNKKLQDLFGYTEEELKDKFMGDFFETEEDMKRVWTEVEKVIQDGRERSVEYNFITKSGEVLPYYYGSGSIMEIGGEKYIIGQTINISEIKKAQGKIAEQLEEIKLLKDQMEAENIYLRHELLETDSYSEIIGESDILKYILYRVEQVASLDTTVLLEGETGTGKELFARAIHQKSNRSNKALITVNCASLPASLIESELFGHEKGAFTGAVQKQIGRFELANGGTLFLDEVGEMFLSPIYVYIYFMLQLSPKSQDTSYTVSDPLRG